MENTLTIGLVDDHPLFREGLRMMIEASPGMEVGLEASNGEELIELLEQGARADVLLLDLEMPKMDGMKTSEILRQSYPDIKLLILTMHQDARLIQYMMKQGANGYVLKSAKWDELKTALLQVKLKDYYFSDLVGLAMLQNLQIPQKSKPRIGNTPQLSRREKEVLELIFQGKTTPEIAEMLFISQRTVEGHRGNLLRRLDVKNTAGLIVAALKHSLVSLDEL